MTCNPRFRGFVTRPKTVRSGPQKGLTFWTVRVKDETCPRNSQSLVVASTHDDIDLAQGLNVTFLIGSVDDQAGQQSPRAVDVMLE